MKTKLQLLLLLLLSITITQAQNVGIGEAVPLQKLHINGTPAGLQTIRIEDCAVTSAGTNAGETALAATTTTTSKKAVYADANGDLTVRYVYGDNAQTVKLPAGSQNIGTTGYTDIIGATITFTPRHSVVYLSFAVSGYDPLGGGASSWFVVAVDNGGTNVGQFLSLSAEYDDTNGGGSGAATVTTAMYAITVTPGASVTLKLKGRVGGVNYSNGFTIDATSFTTYMTIWD